MNIFVFRAKNQSRVRELGKPQPVMVQSNLNYPDSLGLDEIVRMIESLDNGEYEC